MPSGRTLPARQAMDIWTMRLRRSGCQAGQRSRSASRCPASQPSPTCPQPSTMQEDNKTPLEGNKPPGNIPP